MFLMEISAGVAGGNGGTGGAGVTGMKPGQTFEDHTVDDFERLTAINFRGVFLGCEHAVKQFRPRARAG